jgi:hypothetical protein
MQIVISQSMYFPWVGFLQQLRGADAFVLYDDVQFSKGSFTNRVQIKSATGPRWLTVPLRGLHLGQRINEVNIDERQDWRDQHRSQLVQAYGEAPFGSEMIAIVDQVFAQPVVSLSQLAHASTMALAHYFGLTAQLRQYDASLMGIEGAGTSRVLNIVRSLGGTTYLTGHGARNYLDHEAFEKADIAVRYMDYCVLPYPQLYGEFTPYVSALDLVANCGREGASLIQCKTKNWREFINERA